MQAADILAMPSWAARREALAAIEKAQGADAHLTVFRAVWALWSAERDALMTTPGNAGDSVVDRDGVSIGSWRDLNGVIVGTWSDAWRAHCEAVGLLRLNGFSFTDSRGKQIRVPAKRQRHDYLEGVEKKRGKESRDRLAANAMALWRGRKC